MRITILDAGTLGEDLSLDLFSRFGEVTVYQNTPTDSVADRIAEAETIITNKMKLNAQNLANAKLLKLICVTATGYDNIDLAYCREHGIAVCNVVGYSTQCVAQVTVSMVLSLMTHLEEYTSFVRDGSYMRGGCANRLVPVYHEIAGKTWGIVGFGNIGRQVGEVAKALGCRVLVNKRTPIDGWECVDFDTVCHESDILTIHTPLTDQTRGLMDRAHISMLKPDAIVVNVARGAVTDENAIAEAVEQGRIGGFGADVYSVEPFPQDHPFSRILNKPNVCLTPHMAWGGYETRVRLLEEIEKNIDAFLQGEHRNRVD